MGVIPVLGGAATVPAINGPGQRGMTLLSFLFAIAIFGVVGTLALRLIPVYLNHFKVMASLEALQNQPDWASSSREQIVGMLQKHWDIDSVDGLTPRDVEVARDGRNTRVRVAYDVTKPFFHNIDLVIHFDEVIEAETR